MANCHNCNSPLYPDQRTLCGHCRTRQMVQTMQSDHFAEDDVMLPLVGGGQGRHPEDVTDAAVALRDLVLCCAGILGTMLVGWMVWRATQ